jgi:hypothetical protein
MKEAFAVAGGLMSEGNESAHVLRILSDLCDEFAAEGYAKEPAQDRERAVAERRPATALTSEEEELVSGLKAGLARLAGPSRGGPVETAAVQAALDGAEFVARGDILTGQRRRLPQLLPSFAFLAVLPQMGKAEALRVAGRAAQLVAEPQKNG